MADSPPATAPSNAASGHNDPVGAAAAPWALGSEASAPSVPAAEDSLVIGGRRFHSRLMTGTGKYPSLAVMQASLVASACEIVTVAVRRVQSQAAGHGGLLEAIDWQRIWMLPQVFGQSSWRAPSPPEFLIQVFSSLAEGATGFAPYAYADRPQWADPVHEYGHLVDPYGNPSPAWEQMQRLGPLLRSAGVQDGLHEDQVRATWKDLAGDFIARHSEPVSVKNGHLVLRVTQPAMRFHLEQMKPLLLARIQNQLGQDRIQSVKFTLG